MADTAGPPAVEREDSMLSASPESIESFCRRVSPRLVGSLTYHCGSAVVAEELAQEALARAWAQWDRIRTLEYRDAWLYRVAFNLATSQRRRAKAEQRAFRRVAPSTPDLVDPQEASALRDAVSRLPQRQRMAIVLRYYARFSVRETAETMACAEGTVRALTSQGLSSLRQELGDINADTDEQPRSASD